MSIILCWLGFHQGVYPFPYNDRDQKCRRCGKWKGTFRWYKPIVAHGAGEKP